MTTGLPTFGVDDLPALPAKTRKLRDFGRAAFCLLFLVMIAGSASGQSIESKLFAFDPQIIDFENPDIIPHDMQRLARSTRRAIDSPESYWQADISFLGTAATFKLIKSTSTGKNYYFVTFDELDDCLGFSENLIALYGEPYRSYLPAAGDLRHYEIGWLTKFGRMVFDCRELYDRDVRVLTSAYLSSGPISEVKEVGERIKIRCEGVVEAIGASPPYLRHVTLFYVIDDDDRELLSDSGGALRVNVSKFDSESIVLFWMARDGEARFDVTINRVSGNYRYVAAYRGEKARELGSEKFVMNGFCKPVGVQ